MSRTYVETPLGSGKGVLDYDKHLDAYACKSCVQYYDTTNYKIHL